jgi:transcriptional regulator with XRE-family HTH domain
MIVLSTHVLVVDIMACLGQTPEMAEEAIYKAFGRAIATKRKRLNLTQAELAGRVGMSRASVANIESGRQNVLLHHVYSLAAALEFAKISDLLPALSKPSTEEDFDVILSDETMTARGKAQITDLIASALAQRGSKKAGS